MIRYHFLDSRTLPNNADLADINRLLKQLSEHTKEIDWEDVWNVAMSARWLVARDDDHGGRSIVGMACLVIGHKPLGKYGEVHDVIVDCGYRRRGIARRLNELLLEEARTFGFEYIELTSNPTRAEANQLYLSLGYEQRDTNVYRFKLTL